MLLGTVLAKLPPNDDDDDEGDGGSNGSSSSSEDGDGGVLVVWSVSGGDIAEDAAVVSSIGGGGTQQTPTGAHADVSGTNSHHFPARLQRKSGTGGAAVPVRKVALTPCCRGLMAFFFFAAFGYVLLQMVHVRVFVLVCSL
jgi:hypothetical protein